MARKKKTHTDIETANMRELDTYEHADKQRKNIPPAGLAQRDKEPERMKTYAFDPHIDPSLQWAGKAEGLSFQVPTSSIHIHESIKPHKIIASVQKRYSEALEGKTPGQTFMFEAETPADRMRRRREAIEFYKHGVDWTNRLIAGDSLVIMNSLLEKEGMAGQVQMVYIDPPYGIKYGSNFQPFVDKRDVKDRKDDDLTQEPEMIKAFRDTWELGIHSYLTYLRNRLLLARELLADTGSVFVQISDKNVHHVRELCDEVFGTENYCSLIAFQKSGGTTATGIERMCDYIVWYSKNIRVLKYRELYTSKEDSKNFYRDYRYIELDDGKIKTVREGETPPENSRRFRLVPCNSQHYSQTRTVTVRVNGRDLYPGKDRQWSIDPALFKTPQIEKRLFIAGNSLMYKLYADEVPGDSIKNIWNDTAMAGLTTEKIYVVQTSPKAIQRCLHMSTDPGDLVLDITCGSGTTAFVAE